LICLLALGSPVVVYAATTKPPASAKPAAAAIPDLKSSSAIVVEQGSGRTLYAKNAVNVVPIASITKLMTAMVVLDAGLSLDEPILITREDIDTLKHTRSRLVTGSVLTRDELLRLALMASENRAASALARAYPGGRDAFIDAMNQKAMDLEMYRSRFVDSTGLSSGNVSTAQDLARLVDGAYRYPLIRTYSTQSGHTVTVNNGHTLIYNNSNGLVRSAAWDIGLSKTGYISEAGRCLVMQASIGTRPVLIVLLDSWGRETRAGDANRIKRWLETRSPVASVGWSSH